MACDPNTLLSDARCFECLTEPQRAEIITSLYCQLASGPSSSLLNGLIAYWNMDETGSIARQDSFTGNHDLAVVGSVPSAAGVLGNAASFNGVAAPNTNYLINSDAAWDLQIPFTVCCSFKLNTIAVDQSILGPYSETGLFGGQPDGWHFFFNLTSTSLAVRYADGGNAAIDQAVSPIVLSAGVWYFASAVLSVDGFTHLRVNNGPEYTDNHLQPTAAGIPLRVGSDHINLLPMNGFVDNVGIWNRELTDAELTTLYNSGAGLNYPF